MKRHVGRIASLFVILFFGVFISSAFAAVQTGSNDEVSIVANGQAAGEEVQFVVADASVQQDMIVFSDPEKDDEEEDDEDKDKGH